MPTISMFYGILVRMYKEVGVRHNIPHLHAEYNGQEAVYSLDGDILAGEIPSKQRKLMAAWIAIHEEELRANWELLQSGEQVFRIAPLK